MFAFRVTSQWCNVKKTEVGPPRTHQPPHGLLWPQKLLESGWYANWVYAFLPMIATVLGFHFHSELL